MNDKKCNIYVRTFPQTHFLIKFKDEDSLFHIKETFTGQWEKSISMREEQQVTIDTFVTNQRGHEKITCHITIEILGACNNTIHTFNESYCITNKMEEWKWEKHQFNLPIIQESDLQVIPA